MQMNNIVGAPEEVENQFPSALWVKNFIRLSAAVARDVDHGARNTPRPDVIPNRNKIGLHPAMGRRIGTELHDFHWGNG
jgi:hypothetical protein